MEAALDWNTGDLGETISLSVPQKRHCDTCLASLEIVIRVLEMIDRKVL